MENARADPARDGKLIRGSAGHAILQTMFKNAKAFSGFSVRDVAQAKRFYAETLGVEVQETPEGLELRLAEGLRVFLYPKNNHEPATYTVLNFIVDDIDTAVDALAQKNVHMEQYDMGELKTDSKGIARNDSGIGPRAMAWFKDPSGNILGVMQEQ